MKDTIIETIRFPKLVSFENPANAITGAVEAARELCTKVALLPCSCINEKNYNNPEPPEILSNMQLVNGEFLLNGRDCFFVLSGRQKWFLEQKHGCTIAVCLGCELPEHRLDGFQLMLFDRDLLPLADAYAKKMYSAKVGVV